MKARFVQAGITHNRLARTIERVRLTQDTIINAALELLQTYGAADMTMRRVASSLCVAPGALYWHVKNKQDLLRAVAQRVLEPVFKDSDASISTLCVTFHDALLAYQDGAEVVASALAQPGSELTANLYERFATSLRLIRINPELIRPTTAALIHYILGMSIQQQSHEQLSAALSSNHEACRSETDTAGWDITQGVDLIVLGAQTRSKTS